MSLVFSVFAEIALVASGNTHMLDITDPYSFTPPNDIT